MFFLCLISYLFELFTNLSSCLFNSSRNRKTFANKNTFWSICFCVYYDWKKFRFETMGIVDKIFIKCNATLYFIYAELMGIRVNAFLKKRSFLEFSALLLNWQENVEKQSFVLKNVPKSCVLKKLFPAMKPVQAMSIRKTYKSSNLLQKSALAQSL